MLLTSPGQPAHTVEDYDFVFSSGQIMPVTIDREAGDSVSFEAAPIAIQIKLAPKPALSDPSILLPAEEITIFQSHLITIQKRTREVQGLTPEQQEQWKEAIKLYGGTHKGVN